MKINFVTFIILTIIVSGYSCKKGGTGTSYTPLKVKTITMELKSNTNYLKYINMYNYDALGRVSSKLYSPDNTVYTYNYNSNNYFIDQKDSTGKLLTHQEYYLNANSYVDSELEVYPASSSYYYTYQYDLNNNLLRTKYYSDLTGKSIGTFDYTYLNGNPAKKVFINLISYFPPVYDTVTTYFTYKNTSFSTLPVIEQGKTLTFNNLPASQIVTYSSSTKIDTSHYVYTFNNNNMVATSVETNNKSGGETITYTYTY